MSSTITLTLTAEQIEMLKLVLGQVVKPAKAGKGGKGKGTSEPRAKRTGSAPKGVTPPHLVKWNAYVDSVEAELKTMDIEDVWAEWAATNPVDKDGNTKATEEKHLKFKVIRQIAMAIAKARKGAGKMPAEFEHAAMTAEEKAAAKEARKAAKAAAGSSAESSAEESSAESSADAPAKKPRKPRAVKPKVAAPEVVPAAAPVPAPVPAAAALPISPMVQPQLSAEDDDEGITLESWTFKGRKYLRTPDGDCWIQNADGNRGKWAGHYDGTKINASAPEPTVEE
jgi:hypothetical protein